MIAVTPRGAVTLFEDVPATVPSTAFAVATRGWVGTVLYGPDGLAHVVENLEATTPLSGFRKLLSYLYNPQVTAVVTYQAARPYDIDELRQALLSAIDQDDDILTQWHERDELLGRVRNARSYDELLQVVQDTTRPPPGFYDTQPN
jgi:hypothetical protein